MEVDDQNYEDNSQDSTNANICAFLVDNLKKDEDKESSGASAMSLVSQIKTEVSLPADYDSHSHSDIQQNHDHLPKGNLFSSDLKLQDVAAKASGKVTVASKLMERWMALPEETCLSKGVIGVADIPSKTAAKYNQFVFASFGDFMKCPHCEDRVFKYHRDLTRHVMQTHYPFVLRWICIVCNMPETTAFKRKSDLILHYRRLHKDVDSSEKTNPTSYTVSYNNQYIPPMKATKGLTPFPFAEEVLEDALHLLSWQSYDVTIPPLPAEGPCQQLGPYSIHGLDYGDNSDGSKSKSNHTDDRSVLNLSKNTNVTAESKSKRKSQVLTKDNHVENKNKATMSKSSNGIHHVDKKLKLSGSDQERSKAKRKRENPKRYVPHMNGCSSDVDLQNHEFESLDYEEVDIDQSRNIKGANGLEAAALQQAIREIEHAASQNVAVPSTIKQIDGAIESQRTKIDVLEKASQQFQTLLTKARSSEAEMVKKAIELKYEQKLKQIKANHANELADLHHVIKKLTDENEQLNTQSLPQQLDTSRERKKSSSRSSDDELSSVKVSSLEMESQLYFDAFLDAVTILPNLSKREAELHAKGMIKDLGAQLASSERTFERYGTSKPIEVLEEIFKKQKRVATPTKSAERRRESRHLKEEQSEDSL